MCIRRFYNIQNQSTGPTWNKFGVVTKGIQAQVAVAVFFSKKDALESDVAGHVRFNASYWPEYHVDRNNLTILFCLHCPFKANPGSAVSLLLVFQYYTYSPFSDFQA